MTNEEIAKKILDDWFGTTEEMAGRIASGNYVNIALPAEPGPSLLEKITGALDNATAPLQNQIIHLQVQLRQAQQALEAVKTENYNAGVEAAARLIEANEQWFEGARDHIRFAEEIRDLKE